MSSTRYEHNEVSLDISTREEAGEVWLEGEMFKAGYEWMDDIGVDINHFYVSRSHRSEGVGSALLSYILTEVRSEGAEYVVLNMKGGDAAEEFAKANGFDIVVRERNRITAELEFEDDC